MDKQQLLGSELGDAGRDIYIYAHKAPGCTAWGGGKKRQEYGAGVTTAFLLSLFCQVMVQNLKEYKNSEFEAGLPRLFESQNILFHGLLPMWTSGRSLASGPQMLKMWLWS